MFDPFKIYRRPVIFLINCYLAFLHYVLFESCQYLSNLDVLLSIIAPQTNLSRFLVTVESSEILRQEIVKIRLQNQV